MLVITITPTRMYFKDLNESMYNELIVNYDLKSNNKGYYIENDPGKLYQTLLSLAYKYDIEII